MEKNELRIGNFGIDREGRICIVEELSINEEPRILAISGGLTSLPVKSIPLTEEWLLNLGFEKSVNGWWCPKESLNVKLNENSDIESIEIYLRGSSTDLVSSNFKYVHQLQNLYFILMDEELTFKSE